MISSFSLNLTGVPKAKHIPYRDSKLTRILQESLGGNSRTTLIINCSPASFNEAETLSTLRFGIRAKSIKNTARVNAELSPLELKNLLQKAQISNTSYQRQIATLEAELAIWRAGGAVDPSEWAPITGDKAGSATMPKKAPSSPTPSSTRSATPVNPALEGLKELDSRPQTPTVVVLDKDEREEFLKRENELSDQLAEREGALVAAEKLVKELKEELAFLKEQEAASSKVKISFIASYHAPAHLGCVTGKQGNVCPAKRAPSSGRETRVRQQRERHHC